MRAPHPWTAAGPRTRIGAAAWPPGVVAGLALGALARRTLRAAPAAAPSPVHAGEQRPPAHAREARAFTPYAVTERLYYTDAGLTRFDARIVEVAAGGRRVYLDRTAFYPTSGGQPHDTGTLAGEPVVDVVDEGERIAHVLASPIGVAAGASVEGQVDGARRFDHMQQHTGQHLLSAIFAELFGLETVSVHFGAEASTLDLATESLDRERLLEAEARANALVWRNLPVRVTFEDAAAATGLRKRPDRTGEIRVVTIEGIDRSACGGTHVRATGEIGPVLLRKTEKIRREVRVEFLCGGRAVRRARADYDALARAALSLSAPLDAIPTLVEAQRDQLREALAVRRALAAELAAFRARELHERAAPDAAGVRRVTVRLPRGDAEELRLLGQAYAALPRAVLVGVLEEPRVLLLAASEDAGLDAGAELRRALAAAGGRGGGSPRIAQGTAPTPAALDQAAAALGS